MAPNCPRWRLFVHLVVDLCRDSTEAGSNLLKLRVTDGFFWRYEIPSGTVIGPLSDPRPLPQRPLPDRDLAPTKGARIHSCKRSTASASCDALILQGLPDRSRAILTLSALVGAMSLARAVSDESLSREILKTAAELLKKPASEYLES